MNFSKNLVFSFFLICLTSSNNYPLTITTTHQVADLFPEIFSLQNPVFSIKKYQNSFNNFTCGTIFAPFITRNSSGIFFATEKNITFLYMNTLLLTTLVASAIAYKLGYFTELYHYFHPHVDEEISDNLEKNNVPFEETNLP